MPITVNAGIFGGDPLGGIAGIMNAFTNAKWHLITPILTIMGILGNVVYKILHRQKPMHWMNRVAVLTTTLFFQFVLFLMVMVQFSDLFEEIGEYFS